MSFNFIFKRNLTILFYITIFDHVIDHMQIFKPKIKRKLKTYGKMYKGTTYNCVR